MLEKEDVIAGDMGTVFAEFLIEHLPFEEDQLGEATQIAQSVSPRIGCGKVYTSARS